MKNIEKIIVLAIVCIIIVILFILFNLRKIDTTNTLNEVESTEELVENEQDILKRVDHRSDFYAVKGCIEKFYTYYSDMFSSEELKSEGLKAIYNMLDEQYIKENELTEQNLINKLAKINSSKVIINDMYVDKKNEDIHIYIAKGRLREVSTKSISEFKLMIMIDTVYSTYTVFLDDYINKYYKDISLGEKIEIQIPKRIEKNDYNTYDYEIIDDETYARDLINKYKEEILYDRESAYNYLDKEYREKRFGDFSEFESYVKQNTARNVILKLNQYRKKIYDEYTEYICTDTKGNYYIFKEKSVMNYEMLLDTYTVDLNDFVKKYDSVDDNQKVGLNIDKIMTAINEKDYKYVYSKLNNTYKNTYFSDLNVLKKYLQETVYEANKINIDKCEEIGQKTYKNIIKITNKNNAEESKSIIIIMRLLDNREFEISFGIE